MGETDKSTDLAKREFDVQALFRRANEGHKDAMAALRAHLDDNPKLWGGVGDLASQALRLWIRLAAGKNRVVLTYAEYGNIHSQSSESEQSSIECHGSMMSPCCNRSSEMYRSKQHSAETPRGDGMAEAIDSTS